MNGEGAGVSLFYLSTPTDGKDIPDGIPATARDSYKHLEQ
jgi:hypothetical protein